MQKVFLYIDESKQYKNSILYMGGIYGEYSLHAMNQYCRSILNRPYELSSTRREDREEYVRSSPQAHRKYRTHCMIFSDISSDKQYLEALKRYIGNVIELCNPQELSIFADFIRLDENMSRVEKSFSRTLSSLYDRKISLQFLNSKNHLSIQFADMEVGLYRR